MAGRVAGRCVGVAGILLLCAACGLGPQEEPVTVSIPPRQAAPVPTQLVSGVPLSMQVYLLRGAQLVQVTRTVAPGPGLAPTLTALGAALSPNEREQGLRTALPASTQPLQGSIVEGDIARVEVPAGFERLPVREQIKALGQLVFTVTANTLATGVQLVADGRPVAVPDADGHLWERPVSRQDYALLAPPAASGVLSPP